MAIKPRRTGRSFSDETDQVEKLLDELEIEGDDGDIDVEGDTPDEEIDPEEEE